MCCACQLLLSVIQRFLHAPSSHGGFSDTQRAYEASPFLKKSSVPPRYRARGEHTGCKSESPFALWVCALPNHDQTGACDATLPGPHTLPQSSRGSMESVSVFDECSSSINPLYEKKLIYAKKKNERASSRRRDRSPECERGCA